MVVGREYRVGVVQLEIRRFVDGRDWGSLPLPLLLRLVAVVAPVMVMVMVMVC